MKLSLPYLEASRPAIHFFTFFSHLGHFGRLIIIHHKALREYAPDESDPTLLNKNEHAESEEANKPQRPVMLRKFGMDDGMMGQRKGKSTPRK